MTAGMNQIFHMTMFAIYSTYVIHSWRIHWVQCRDWMWFCSRCPRTAPACSTRMQCLWRALCMAHMRWVCTLFKQCLAALMVSLLLGRQCISGPVYLARPLRTMLQSVFWNQSSHTHWSYFKHSSQFKGMLGGHLRATGQAIIHTYSTRRDLEYGSLKGWLNLYSIKVFLTRKWFFTIIFDTSTAYILGKLGLWTISRGLGICFICDAGGLF